MKLNNVKFLPLDSLIILVQHVENYKQMTHKCRFVSTGDKLQPNPLSHQYHYMSL